MCSSADSARRSRNLLRADRSATGGAVIFVSPLREKNGSAKDAKGREEEGREEHQSCCSGEERLQARHLFFSTLVSSPLRVLSGPNCFRVIWRITPRLPST